MVLLERLTELGEQASLGWVDIFPTQLSQLLQQSALFVIGGSLVGLQLGGIRTDLALIASGKAVTYKISVPEGFTSQMARNIFYGGTTFFVLLFAALILHAVGVPSELFTPIFAIGRTSGWTAHMLDQIEDARLIRPASIYVGPRDYKFVPINERN